MTPSFPKISVVMSVHNGDRFLSEAIESILHQTFEDFEFIIVDDGSTDDTWSMLTRCRDPRVRLLQNPNRRGLAHSLNRAIASARAPIIARMDADDISEPRRLEVQYRFLEAHPEIAVVGCFALEIDATGRPMGILERPVTAEEIRGYAFEKGSPFIHGSVLMRGAALRRVGGYDERFKAAQDCDLWLRLLERHTGVNIPEPLYRLRRHRGAVSWGEAVRQRAYAELARELARARGRGENVIGGPLAAYFNARFRQIERGDLPAWLVGMVHREEAVRLLYRKMTTPAAAAALRAIRAEGLSRDNLWLLRAFLASLLRRWIGE